MNVMGFYWNYIIDTITSIIDIMLPIGNSQFALTWLITTGFMITAVLFILRKLVKI